MKIDLRFGIVLGILLTVIIWPHHLLGQNSHKVTQGQTLFSIARYYGLSVDQIKDANNLDSNILEVGQILSIPNIETTDDEGYYEVRPGDTLFGLSQRFEIAIDSIKAWNKLNQNSLSVGQRLLISPPASTGLSINATNQEPEVFTISGPSSENTSIHLVKRGESLYRIARLYNMEIGQLKRLNQLKNNTLAIGQKLIITPPPATKLSATEQTVGQRGAFSTLTVNSRAHFESIMTQYNLNEMEIRALNPQLGNIVKGAKIAIYQNPNNQNGNPYLLSGNTSNSIEGKSAQGSGSDLAIDLFSESDMAMPLSSGELYNPKSYTVGHPKYAVGTILKVINLSSGQTSFGRVAHKSIGAILISKPLADEIGFTTKGQSGISVVKLDK